MYAFQPKAQAWHVLVPQTNTSACGAGNLRDDILKCKEAAEAAPGAGAEAGPPLGAVSSRGLGQHYLQRYFLLIAFRCYLGANPVQVCRTGGQGELVFMFPLAWPSSLHAMCGNAVSFEASVFMCAVKLT